jgi:putative flippase GtrA
MLKLHDFISKLILDLIDWVYPLFRKFMPLQTFRYAACGGGNTILDILGFFLSYNYLFHKQPIHVGWLTISPHIASFMVSFCVTFPIGFYLSRYVVFQETAVKKTEQLLKYFFVVLGCIFLNYAFLKFFVDYLGWFATPAKIVTTFFVVIFSYTTQKNFTFKATKSGDLEAM